MILYTHSSISLSIVQPHVAFSRAIQQYFSNLKASLEMGVLCFETLHWTVRFAERVLESAHLIEGSTTEAILKFLVSALLHALAGAEECDIALSWRSLRVLWRACIGKVESEANFSCERVLMELASSSSPLIDVPAEALDTSIITEALLEKARIVHQENNIAAVTAAHATAHTVCEVRIGG